jgi:hypothetical protein
MARGWESKSVESQIDMAATAAATATARVKQLTPEALDRIRRREGLNLSRTRVVRELETAQNPRYKAVLGKALADLDAQLKILS